VLTTTQQTTLAAEHTPAPWAEPFEDELSGVPFLRIETDQPTGPKLRDICEVSASFVDGDFVIDDETWSNARLIAAAPDHALIGWAVCVAAGRWEPSPAADGRGEFCINGIRFSTRLDEFGVPAMTDGLRAAIAKARGVRS
jgi:hypothetical protein